MSAHTPGPWEVHIDRVPGYSRKLTVSTPDNLAIADILGAGSINETVLAQVEADAHLIAAAPDLLAACEYANRLLSAQEALSPAEASVVLDLRAAIAKAEPKP